MVLLDGQLLGGPALLVESSSCCSSTNLELTNQLSRNLKSLTTATTTTSTTTTRHVSSCLHCSFRPCYCHVRPSKLPFRPSRNIQQSRDCVHGSRTCGGWQLLEHVRLFFDCLPRGDDYHHENFGRLQDRHRRKRLLRWRWRRRRHLVRLRSHTNPVERQTGTLRTTVLLAFLSIIVSCLRPPCLLYTSPSPRDS